MRYYSTPVKPRLGSVILSLASDPVLPYLRYDVSGGSRAAVDSVADRIEAFAQQHRTWNNARYAELAKKSPQLLALMMFPLALALRDRRFVWLLIPLSLAMLATSCLVPFNDIFTNVKIHGTPSCPVP